MRKKQFHLWQLKPLNADIADGLVYQPGRSNVREPLDLQDHGPGQCTPYYNVLELDFRALIKDEDVGPGEGHPLPHLPSDGLPPSGHQARLSLHLRLARLHL